jgi:TRAP-type C4-dicarboxylate transport system permease small subunit
MRKGNVPGNRDIPSLFTAGGMDVPEAPIVEQEAVYKKPKNIFDKTVVFSFSFITFSMSLVLTTLIVIATILRYVLEVDLYGYEEWVKLFAFWLYFSGAALGAFNGTHVSADLVQSYIPNGKLKNFLVFLKDLVTVVVSGLFVWYGYEFFWFGFRGPLGTGVALPMTTAWRIPFWTSYLAVFIGLIFMFWYFARDLCKSTRKLLVGGNQ